MFQAGCNLGVCHHCLKNLLVFSLSREPRAWLFQHACRSERAHAHAGHVKLLAPAVLGDLGCDLSWVPGLVDMKRWVSMSGHFADP